FSCGTSISSVTWNGITNPTGNLALTMGHNTSTWTFDATTSSTNMFTLADTASNTGTGSLFYVATVSGSAATPAKFQVLVSGNTTPTLTACAGASCTVAISLYNVNQAGLGINRIEGTGGPFEITMGGSAASNEVLYNGGSSGVGV